LKTKLTPLALLIPTVVLAQPAPQAPQSFQANPPGMNQQVNPANTPNSSGTAAQTFIKQNSGSVSPPVNPVAAAAYEKASKTTKTMGSSKAACVKTSFGTICTKSGNID